MLKDLVSEGLVQLRVFAGSWEQAIELGMRPLLESGCVEQSYVDACVANVKRYGPYIVITKHVALVHAECEKGVLKNALGITTLASPVCFGNEENDPVSYLFCLSALGSNGHVEALAELAELLQEASFYSALDAAASPADVIALLESPHAVALSA